MKKAILIAGILFLAQSVSYAQQIMRLLAKRDDQFVNNAWKNVDSAIYTYTGSRGGIDAEGYSAVGFDNGTTYQSDSTGWHYASRAIDTYDGSNRIINNDNQTYVNGNWREYYRYVYTYDAAGNMLSADDQVWDTLSSSWHSTYTDSYTYDGQNNTITHLIRSRNSGSYGNESLDSMSYDANGNKTQAIYLTWDGSQWVRTYLNIYTYNASNKQTRNLTRRWNTNTWTDDEVDTMTYDGQHNLLSETILSWNGSTWETFNQYLYQYDGNNHNTIRVTNLPDNTNTSWVLNERDSMAYDGSGNEIAMVFSYYSSGVFYTSSMRQNTYSNNLIVTQINSALVSGAWVPNSKYEMLYNGNGYRTSEISYSYQGSSWAPSYATYDWYEAVAGIQELKQNLATTISPNPARDRFELQFEAVQPGLATLCLYDLSGKLITTTKTIVQSGSNVLSWDAFPLSKGMYVYELSVNNAIGRGKLVME